MEKTREKTRSNIASEVSLETVNESKGGTRQLLADASLKNMTATECRCNANDAMMKCMTWTKCKTKDKNPSTEKITYRISGKGKSWSYEYGKLYPGRYS